MLTGLDGYAALLLVPMVCVAAQLLYLKSGQRYDLGAVTYVATGAFVASTWFDGGEADIVGQVALILGVATICAFALRFVALAYGRPADFTLISFGQLWATPALIDYELQKLTTGSGVAVAPLPISASAVALGALCLAALSAYAIRRSSLPERLVALTEARSQYRLLCGPPAWLAIRVEACAFSLYFVAGVLMRLTTNDLSATSFGAEGIWCVLAAAPIARASGVAVVAGPLGATLLRLGLKSMVPARFAAMSVYAVLALALAWTASRAGEASRDLAD